MIKAPTIRRMQIQLLDRHVAFLKRLSAEIHQSNGIRLTPSAIVRGFVEALDETGGVNADYITCEEDLVEVFLRKLTGQEEPPHARERMRPE